MGVKPLIDRFSLLNLVRLAFLRFILQVIRADLATLLFLFNYWRKLTIFLDVSGQKRGPAVFLFLHFV